MELDKVKKLIEKYFEAETSLQEEKFLKEYFSGDLIDEELAQYKPFFGYFKENRQELKQIEIALPQKRNPLKWLSIAALLMLMVSVYSYQNYQAQQKKEAQIAFEQTQKALKLISQNLNKGNGAVAQLKYYNEAQEIVFKNE